MTTASRSNKRNTLSWRRFAAPRAAILTPRLNENAVGSTLILYCQPRIAKWFLGTLRVAAPTKWRASLRIPPTILNRVAYISNYITKESNKYSTVLLIKHTIHSNSVKYCTHWTQANASTWRPSSCPDWTEAVVIVAASMFLCSMDFALFVRVVFQLSIFCSCAV